MIAGPLILLRDRRFNDVLDGATFGVASAAAFVAAQILVGSASLFAGGLTADRRAGRVDRADPRPRRGAAGRRGGGRRLGGRGDLAPLPLARARPACARHRRKPVVARVMAGVLLVATALAAQLPGPIVDVDGPAAARGGRPALAPANAPPRAPPGGLRDRGRPGHRRARTAARRRRTTRSAATAESRSTPSRSDQGATGPR